MGYSKGYYLSKAMGYIGQKLRVVLGKTIGYIMEYNRQYL